MWYKTLKHFLEVVMLAVEICHINQNRAKIQAESGWFDPDRPILQTTNSPQRAKASAQTYRQFG